MGKKAKYLCWNHPGNDVTGLLARSEKVAGTFEKLLGGELYHYHTKLIMKDAFEGGAHNWHQDYGYWYHNGCIKPDMGSVFIAVDKADQTNGCLKIVPKSHKLGRIDHIAVGDEVGADPERVSQILPVLPLVHAELEAGDAVFFHSNVLHRSEQNSSPNRRWAFIIAYNRADNNPVKVHHHPQYTPLNKVPNSALLNCDEVANDEGKDFFLGQSNENKSLKERTVD
ncbi:unnamed protein product [Owenia fusiformis]|nr:unnamed protein product [Owenia fusiformis]